MKIVERFACVDCEKDLTTAGLVHKRVPNTEGSCRCDFCKQRRYCTQYLIQYGRTDRHASVSAGSR